jgi:hypothetical protein
MNPDDFLSAAIERQERREECLIRCLVFSILIGCLIFAYVICAIQYRMEQEREVKKLQPTNHQEVGDARNH